MKPIKDNDKVFYSVRHGVIRAYTYDGIPFNEHFSALKQLKKFAKELKYKGIEEIKLLNVRYS